MKVESGNRATGPTVRKARAKDAGPSGFADALSDAAGAEAASGPLPTSSIASVDALLALQGSDDQPERRNRAIARGHSLLDQLENLRREILLGRVSRDRLVALARDVREQRAQVDDEQLTALIDEIELRAQVELAKFERDNR